ncbi:MAG: LPP20 family lipoprotein [Nautiliaceae bacterium]|jgi:hypothetical protein
MKKFILAVIIIFLIGCQNAQPPKWFNETPKSNQLYIYATGMGYSKKDAINNALSFAASQVNVTINSSFESSKSYMQNNDNSQIFKEIRKDTKSYANVEFSDYQIVKEAAKENKYYVLIKINKEKSANVAYQKAINTINQAKAYLNIKDKIKILKTYPKLIKELNKAIKNLYIVQTLTNKNISKEIQQAISLKTKLQTKLSQIGVNVKVSNYKIKTLLQDTFSQLNIPTYSNGIKVYATSSIENKQILSNYISTLTLNVTLKDKSAINFSIKCGGKSSSNFSNAMDFALQNCQNKLKEKLEKIFKN